MMSMNHATASRAVPSTPSRTAPSAVLEVLEPRLLFSGDTLTADLGDALNFDADTSEFLNASLGDVTPTGTSYMIYDAWGGTWVDAEKTPSNSEDDLMCWAAAASNILDWTGWGDVAGLDGTDDIFQYFNSHWTDQGGLMEFGWDWWFDGTNNSQGWSGWSQEDVQGGGFYMDENFRDYYHYQNYDDQAMSSIDSFLRAGYGTTIGIFGPGGHAITVWGYNYDDSTGAYNGIWVTDSDDYKYTDNPPDKLRYYEIEQSSGRWYLQNYYGSNSWYIGTVMALAQKPGNADPAPEIDIEANSQDSMHSFDFGEVDVDSSVSQTFTIRNEGTADLVISEIGGLDGAFTIDVINGSGNADDWTIAAGGTFSFTVTFTPADFGQFADQLTLLSNDSDEAVWTLDLAGESRDLTTIYQADMSVDPGWVLEGDWAYGVPTGEGGEYGSPDPDSGATGDYVIGYNLSGDYSASLSTTQYATTGAINCMGYENVTLSFQRWLGVESSTWDHASLQVRSATGDWVSLWANAGAVTDSGWVEVTYDISAVADNNNAVYIRWGMGTTDSSWQYCGWNIDDVVIRGESMGETAVVAGTSGGDTVVIQMAEAGGSHSVTVNGETTYYDADTYAVIEFDGGEGEDLVLVYGTGGDDSVVMAADGTLTWAGGSFGLSLLSSEHMIAYSGGGTSLVSMIGTAGDDVLRCYGGTSYLDGQGETWAYSLKASGFDAVAVDGQSGNDTAYLYGQSNSTDVAVLSATYGRFYGSGYSVSYTQFENVTAEGQYANRDRAYFYGTEGSDIFVLNAQTFEASMTGEGYANASSGFFYHYAYGQGGHDQAYVYGSGNGSYLTRRGTSSQISSRTGWTRTRVRVLSRGRYRWVTRRVRTYGASGYAQDFENTRVVGRGRSNTFYDYDGVYGMSIAGRWRVRGSRYVTYLATNQFGGRWADAEKSPTNTQDDLMCWAAAASNVLEYTGWGDVQGISNTDAAFRYYQDNWTDQGGMMQFGWEWWFNGQNDAQGYAGWSQVDGDGGAFFQDESFSSYFRSSSNQRYAPQTISNFLRGGYGTTIGIYGPGGHALTVWGVRHDRRRSSRIIGIYVTDSDDSKGSTNPTDQLRYYGLSYNRRARRWNLRGYGGSNSWYIGVVQGLAQRPGSVQGASQFACRDDFSDMILISDTPSERPVDTEMSSATSTTPKADSPGVQLAMVNVGGQSFDVQPAGMTYEQPAATERTVQASLSPHAASEWLFGERQDSARPSQRLVTSLNINLRSLATENLLRSAI